MKLNKPEESIIVDQSVVSVSLMTQRPAEIRGIFCCHGGISEKLRKVEDLALYSRCFNDFSECEEQQVICDLLWADPDPSCDGFAYSQRGCGRNYGSRAVK